jgi:hypothetical protein
MQPGGQAVDAIVELPPAHPPFRRAGARHLHDRDVIVIATLVEPVPQRREGR